MGMYNCLTIDQRSNTYPKPVKFRRELFAFSLLIVLLTKRDALENPHSAPKFCYPEHFERFQLKILMHRCGRCFIIRYNLYNCLFCVIKIDCFCVIIVELETDFGVRQAVFEFFFIQFCKFSVLPVSFMPKSLLLFLMV